MAVSSYTIKFKLKVLGWYHTNGENTLQLVISKLGSESVTGLERPTERGKQRLKYQCLNSGCQAMSPKLNKAFLE